MILMGSKRSRRRISPSYTFSSNRVQIRAAAVRDRRKSSQSVRHHYTERLVDTAQRNDRCVGNDGHTVHSHLSRFLGVKFKTSHNERKSANKCPPLKNNILVFFGVFFVIIVYFNIYLYACFPFRHLTTKHREYEMTNILIYFEGLLMSLCD